LSKIEFDIDPKFRIDESKIHPEIPRIPKAVKVPKGTLAYINCWLESMNNESFSFRNDEEIDPNTLFKHLEEHKLIRTNKKYKKFYYSRVTESIINNPKLILKKKIDCMKRVAKISQEGAIAEELVRKYQFTVKLIERGLKEKDDIVNRLADKDTITFAKDLQRLPKCHTIYENLEKDPPMVTSFFKEMGDIEILCYLAD
jgi:hypothetical protein